MVTSTIAPTGPTGPTEPTGTLRPVRIAVAISIPQTNSPIRWSGKM